MQKKSSNSQFPFQFCILIVDLSFSSISSVHFHNSARSVVDGRDVRTNGMKDGECGIGRELDPCDLERIRPPRQVTPVELSLYPCFVRRLATPKPLPNPRPQPRERSNTIDGGLPAIHQPTPSSPRSETFPQVKPPPNPSRLGRRTRARFVCLDSSLLLIGFFFAPCSCYSWQLN